MDYKKVQNNLAEQKGLGLYEKDELKYVQQPLGKAIYTTKKVGRPISETPSHWSDRVKCDVCGDYFTRSARSNHNKTRHHRDYEKMNYKIKELLLD